MSTSPRWLTVLLLDLVGVLSAFGAGAADSALLDIERRVAHGFATNNGVRIHYAVLGQGPLVVMIHAPDLVARSIRSWLAR